MIYPDVLVISLAHRREWCDDLIASLRSAGFTNASVLNAVDWRDLPESPPWVIGSLPPVYPYPGWCQPYGRHALTLGQVGCALSHILAWHRVVELDRPALILEDDAVLVDDLADQLPHVFEDLSHIDYSVCYFYQYSYKEFGPLVGRLVHRIIDYCPISTCAYMVTPSGARTLLSIPWQTHLTLSDVLLPAAFALYFLDPSLNILFAGADSTPQSRGTVVSTHQPFFTVRTDSFFASETTKSVSVLEERDGFLALTVSVEETETVRRLCWSARRYGFSFEILGLGGSGSGGFWKVNALRSRLADVPSDTVILFTDAYDGIVNGFVNDILAVWRSMGEKIVFASSRVCLPDDRLMDLYPAGEERYRFLNSCIFMGRAGDLRHLLGHEISDGGDDHRYYAELFLGLRGDKKSLNGSGVLSDKIILDTECILFQSLHGALDDVVAYEDLGRLYNERMKSWPCVIHAGGSEARDWLEGGGRSVGGRYFAHHGDTESGIPGI